MDDNFLFNFNTENSSIDDYFNQKNFESEYYSVRESTQFFSKKKFNNFSILNLNFRSINKNFDNLKLLLHDLNHDFKIISLTETWLKSNEKNFNYELNNYVSIHQPRKTHVGGGISIFIHKSINFILRNDVNVNDTDCSRYASK